MKTFFALFVFALLALAPVFAQPTVRGSFAEPVGAEIVRFPIMPRPLTLSQQAELGLTAIRLDASVVVENHFRNLRDAQGRFVLETLPVGTIVLVDRGGKLRYKADCGNRLVEVPKPSADNAATGADKGKDGKGNVTAAAGTGANKPGLWKRFTDATKSAAKGMWNFIGALLAPFGWLLLFSLGFLLLALIGYLLYRLIRAIVDAFRNRGQGGGGAASAPNPNPPAPQPNPNPPAPAPPAPVPVVAPAPAVPAPVAPAPVVPAPNPPAPAPTPNPTLTFDPAVGGRPNRLVFAGLTDVHFDHDPATGMTTIRFRNA